MLLQRLLVTTGQKGFRGLLLEMSTMAKVRLANMQLWSLDTLEAVQSSSKVLLVFMVGNVSSTLKIVITTTQSLYSLF